MTDAPRPRPANLRAARDQLLGLRTDYATAVAEFRWPDVGERFNWAHDWFDTWARDNDAPGLVVVEEDGSRAEFSFADLVRRSDQVAGMLADAGLRRGDSVIVMLGNQVELWESMLAIIKLGAVVMPTTTAVGPTELVDRMTRGDARAVICNAADAGKFGEVPGDYLLFVVGDASGATTSYAAAYDREAEPVPHPGNATTDRMLLYFTSGTTSRPKLVEHTHRTYPVGHLSTMYWLGLRARRRAPQHLLPGMGQARLVELLRAVARGGDGAGVQLRPLRPGCAARADPSRGRDDLLRSSDGVADADQRRPDRRARRAA